MITDEQGRKSWKITTCCLVLFLLGLPTTGYSQSVQTLIQDMGNPRDNWKMREKALKALVREGSSAVDPLIAALKSHKNYRVRRSAAEALGEIRATKAIKPLVAAMGERDEYVRGSAATALKDIGKASVGPLIAALKHNSWMVRENAAWALGKIGDSKAVGPLEKLAKRESDARVRDMAKEALAKIR